MTPPPTASDPVLVAARRSAIGRAGGRFRARTADQLAAPAIRAALTDAGLPAEAVDAVILGNALEGGNMARVAALAAGLPASVPALTLDRQCAAGLDAVVEAVARVAAGRARVVLAGGLESCSTAPWRMARPTRPNAAPRVLNRARFGAGDYGDPDPVPAAAALIRAHGLDRGVQDAWAARSHANALAAEAAGAFAAERVAVPGACDGGADEAPKPGLDAARLARLRPLSADSGEITAGTTAPEADGAAVLLVVAADLADALGLRRRLRLLDSAEAGCPPAEAGLAAVPAIRALAQRRGGAGWADLDAVAFTEAFAGQTLACLRAAGLPEGRTNRRGGALAFGHPYGASGALLALRLFHDLAPGQTGLAAVSAMGGQGTAALFRAL